MDVSRDDSKSVFVSNISPNATEKTVSDFFSFCGKITRLQLSQDEGRPTKSAVVQFETESAAKTALLLSNALIVDMPIAVVPLSAAASAAPPPAVVSAPPAAPDDITTREFGVPDEHRSKTSVVISLLAAGYVLGEDSIQRAKEFDEKHNILLQARIAVEQVKSKALEVDQKLHISERVIAVKEAVEEKAKQVDEKYQISDKAQHAANVVRDKTNETIAKLKENPKFAEGFSKINELADQVKAQVTLTYNDIQQQVTAKVAEKRAAERAASESSSSVEAQPVDAADLASAPVAAAPSPVPSAPTAEVSPAPSAQ